MLIIILRLTFGVILLVATLLTLVIIFPIYIYDHLLTRIGGSSIVNNLHGAAIDTSLSPMERLFV